MPDLVLVPRYWRDRMERQIRNERNVSFVCVALALIGGILIGWGIH